MSNHDNQIQTIDYRWIIQTLSRGEQGQEFFDLYSAINPNPYSYSESELYLHYFRLFNPVEYLHPTFDECDNNMSNMLLQLLFGNLTAECTLTHSTDNTLPELEFNYPPVGTMKCSELTTDILKPLLLCLLSDAFASILPQLAAANIDTQYSSLLPTDRPLYKQELENLYADNTSFAESAFEKLSHYYTHCFNK